MAQESLRAAGTLKVALFGAVMVALLGMVALAVRGEARESTGQTVAARPVLPTPRPARSQAEAAYVEALWPIHTEVERAEVRVALGASFYKLGDLPRAELKTRLEAALLEYRQAGQQLQALRPPDALVQAHTLYRDSLALFEQSTVEMLRMFDDGSDEHLSRGFPLSLRGSDGVHEVSTRLWPDEYPPN